jgi:site-specific recombinase XerD
MSKNERSKILLPNGCSCNGKLGDPENGIPHSLPVTPKNWKQAKKINGPWRIVYRFYDPSQPKAKQVTIRLMNEFKTIGERKEATQNLINDEIQMLKTGWNPFYKKVIGQRREEKYEIEPNTLFIDALKKVLKRKTLEPSYYKHFENYIIPNMRKAAVHLGYDFFLISEVKRKHIIYMLDHLRETNKDFTDNTFNRFRTDLKILFKELLKIEAVDTNPINDIDPIVLDEKEERVVLTPQERTYLNQYLAERHPAYHRMLHMFFHSSSRSTELCRLRCSDVDLENQRFKREIRKGIKYRIVWTQIPDIAMKYWVEHLANCNPNDYVFSNGLNPGPKQITPQHFTKLWYRWVKKQFVVTPGTKRTKGKYIDRIHIINGKKTTITADWNCLRHLNITENVDEVLEAIEQAQKIVTKQTAHTTEKMIAMVYDIRKNQRANEKLKKANNPFA